MTLAFVRLRDGYRNFTINGGIGFEIGLETVTPSRCTRKRARAIDTFD
jgi:hypothetical protein